MPEGMWFAILFGTDHMNSDGIVFRGFSDDDNPDGAFHDIHLDGYGPP